MNKARIDRLRERAFALCGQDPPTFAAFSDSWAHMDPLSKSLYETACACPELVGTPRHWPTIRNYLHRMGVDPEPFTMEGL